MVRNILVNFIILIFGFNAYVKVSNWWYKKSTKCDLCGNSLFRFGTHGGIDIKDGNRKFTAYVCGLCYQLHKNK